MNSKVSLRVGDGSIQHFVEGDYETIKLLQAKLLRAEAIEAGLRRAIGVLNSIPNRMVPHEGKKTYVIIPELEKVLKGTPTQTEFEEGAKRMRENSQYGKLSEKLYTVHELYYDGREFHAVIDKNPIRPPMDYPFFQERWGKAMFFEALHQKKGPVSVGFHSCVPPIMVTLDKEGLAVFRGTKQLEVDADEDSITIS